MSYFSAKEFEDYDPNRVTVSGVSKSEKASKAKELVMNNSNFRKSPEAFRLFTMAYLNDDTPGNIEYVAKAAINKNVIMRPNEDPDYMLLDAINSVEVWTEDPKVLKEMSNENKVLSLKADLKEFRFIMNLLTTDFILDREDALSVVKEVSNFNNNKDAKKFVMEEFTQSLYASGTFLRTSGTFQESLRSLLSDAQSPDYKNANYIFMAAGNKSVIEREDLSVFSSISKANYFLDADLSWQEGLEQGEIKEVLRHELDNFDLIMTTLTSEQILDRSDAATIIESTFTYRSSEEALTYLTDVSSSVNSKEAVIDAMVTEATAPQVDSMGLSK